LGNNTRKCQQIHFIVYNLGTIWGIKAYKILGLFDKLVCGARQYIWVAKTIRIFYTVVAIFDQKIKKLI